MAVKHYVDEIPPSTGRVYQIETNGNSSQIIDITKYQQVGTGFGASDVNSACVLECNYSKSGTVHKLTTENTASENIKFFATADFNKGDTFTFNGASVTAQTTDGQALGAHFFKANTIVKCSKRGNVLYFEGGNSIIDDTTGTSYHFGAEDGNIYVETDDSKMPVETFVQGGRTLSGSTAYTIENSVDYPIVGLKVYGKSTQEGTPTPENPVEIVSVENPTVTACGKNLLNYDAWKNVGTTSGTSVFENNGVTITATADDAFTKQRVNEFPKNAIIPITVGETITISWEESMNISGKIYVFPNGELTGMVNINNSISKKLSYTATEGVDFVTFRFGVQNKGDTISYKNIQIEKGSTATDYEPYKSNILTLPDTLHGIPVSSGGNVTIDGQEYISDYVDFEQGKLIRRLGVRTLNGTESPHRSDAWAAGSFQISGFFENNVQYDNYGSVAKMICNFGSSYMPSKIAYGTVGIGMYLSSLYLNIGSDYNTSDLIKQYFAENPCDIYYELATPIETPISETELQAYRQLATYNGTTNIINDKGAGIEATYCTSKALSNCVAPIKTDLQKQIDELKAAVISLGGNV